MRIAALAAAVGATLILAEPAFSQQPAGRQGGAGRGGGPGGIELQADGSCPPGTTLIRPGSCGAPQMEPPSILDYRPRSTLVTTETPVQRAKFPVIDWHFHGANMLNSDAGVAQLQAAMDSLNLRIMLATDNVSGDRLVQLMARLRETPLRDRVRFFTGVNLNGVGPGWAERAVAQLEADVAAGAVGVGEIGKGFGLSIRKADGSRLRLDDPDLDPFWQACARLGVPILLHTADPQEFFEEIDYQNERWLELALFPNRRFPREQYPSFEQLMTERDNLFRRHPRTTFVAAHMGWHANDLARLGKMLDEMPNVHVEVGAVLYDFGRQPRAGREFFIRYQDRILFGKDAFQPVEYPYFWRVFETADEYFDYYRPYHAFWKLYGLALPDTVLKKLYYQNALRITKGLPSEGWPR